MGLSGRFTHIYVILNCLRQVCFLGRAPRTKESLPDFRESGRVTRQSRVFRRLTGSQRTPVNGASHNMKENALASCISYARSHRVESGVGAWYCYSPFLVNEW